MTGVDEDYIEAISRSKYTVGSDTTDTISSSTLSLFLSWALDQIAADLPNSGLTTTQLEQAEGFLVCHYIEIGSVDKISETIDNYSYTRKEGGSPWWTAYQILVSSIKCKARSAIFTANQSGVTRADADILYAMGYIND